MLSKDASRLKDMINHALEDLEITTSEYEKILALAHDDQHIDAQEQQLLKQLHDMISNGVVKRVPG